MPPVALYKKKPDRSERDGLSQSEGLKVVIFTTASPRTEFLNLNLPWSRFSRIRRLYSGHHSWQDLLHILRHVWHSCRSLVSSSGGRTGPELAAQIVEERLWGRAALPEREMCCHELRFPRRPCLSWGCDATGSWRLEFRGRFLFLRHNFHNRRLWWPHSRAARLRDIYHPTVLHHPGSCDHV